MFVTRQKVLEENIGREEAAQVLTAIKMTPTATFVNLADDIETADQAAVIVRNVTKQNSIAGVVIIGGYDVVPADRLDVLDAPSRQRLQQMDSVRKDADRFIVFSDEIYGDTDGDYIAELPVSRIPDGRRADVVLNALNAGSFVSDRKFGVRNINRPFAAQVFPKIPGVRVDLNVSEQFAPAECPDGAAAGAVYLMLHGDHQDASRFWGEDSSGMAFEAFAVSNVPKTLKGTVVFAGCCWGALSMAPPAGIASATSSLRPRSPESSIAMAYLQAGAGVRGMYRDSLLSRRIAADVKLPRKADA